MLLWPVTSSNLAVFAQVSLETHKGVSSMTTEQPSPSQLSTCAWELQTTTLQNIRLRRQSTWLKASKGRKVFSFKLVCCFSSVFCVLCVTKAKARFILFRLNLLRFGSALFLLWSAVEFLHLLCCCEQVFYVCKFLGLLLSFV